MTHQYKLTLLVTSLVAAFAANVAVAGNIVSSSVAIARESITDDAQVVNAPKITYTFQGSVDATSQSQTLQVQLILTGGGQWNSAMAGSIDMFGASISSNGVTQPAAVLPGTGGATQPLIGTTATANDTLFITFTVPQGANNNFPTPTVRFTPTTGVVATLKGLFTSPVKVVAPCDTVSYTLPVAIKHFTGVTSPAALADGVANGTADEHVRNGANSTGKLLTFPTVLNLSVIPSGAVAGSPGSAKVDPAAPTKFKAAADATTINTTLVDLGSVTLVQQSTGIAYDSGLADFYAFNNTTTGVASATKNGSVVATASDGFVEADSLSVTVQSTLGFATGSSLYLSLTPNCGAAIAGTTVATTAANSVTLPVNAAGLTSIYANAAGAAAAPYPAYGAFTTFVCYSVAGATSAIPPSSFTGTAVWNKAPGTIQFKEQNNSCFGPLFPLASGVKVDVRNYATDKTAGNWMSVIRLINPSEVNTAKVYGQLIHSDGSYGGWGVLAPTLAPRAVLNLTSAQIAALLTNAPATNGAGYVGGATASAASGTGDRLRVTADGVGSLRVQNYLFNPDSKNFIEASSSQGVDFDGNADRAPVNEGQYQDQDAQRGLAK